MKSLTVGFWPQRALPMLRFLRLFSTFLRPYQKECIKHSLEHFESGINRQAVSLPVGAGKTVSFAWLGKGTFFNARFSGHF
jgi:superfamily II DNA or RNA helicase